MPEVLHRHEHLLLLIGWNSVVWILLIHFLFFPIHRVKAAYEPRILFSRKNPKRIDYMLAICCCDVQQLLTECVAC